LRRIRKTLIGVTVVAGLLAPTAVAAQPSAAVSPGQPALAHDKSRSPATDLRQYPKQKTAPETRAKASKPAAGQNQSGEVLVDQPLPDGATRYTSYTPIKGVTPEQLAARLQKKGANAKVVTSSESSGGISTFSDSPCAYGTARSMYCPVAYWRNNGYDDPQVYFIDHTSALWPTDAAVYAWNQSYGIDSYYAWGGCPGYGGTHCIDVWSGNYGATGWGSSTTYSVSSDGSIVEWSAVSKLNEYYGYSGTQRRSAVCHALGHALGLGDAVGGSSCMVLYAGDYPSSDDYGMLANIYAGYR
jgi:hypothetical protein